MFKKAVKHELKLRMMVSGPSGYGKTYSALAMATALGGPVAVVDTEHGKSALYSDIFEFDIAEMHAPFEPRKYVQAIRAAEQAGYQVLVIDSLSHAWAGPGGVLDYVDQVAKRSKTGNSFAAWKEGTPLQNELVEAILQSNLHVIATARAKTEYVLETNERGRQTPRKVGMKSIQRDDLEYEFDVWFELLDTDNNAAVQKTRCSALQGLIIEKPGAQVVETLKEWMKGAPLPPRPVQTDGNGKTPGQQQKSEEEARARGLKAVNASVGELFGKDRTAFYKWTESTWPEDVNPVPYSEAKGRRSLDGSNAEDLRSVYRALQDLKQERAQEKAQKTPAQVACEVQS